MAYAIIWSRESIQHLRGLTAAQRKSVIDGVEIQLVHEPTKITRNRKKLRPNPIASWALRLGALRVFYEVEERAHVHVLAVGTKKGNSVYIGGEEIQLKHEND